jgi:DNA repair photolyase
MNTSLWPRPATIERNNFKFKSLSCWSYNIAIGCAHACRFCYVPDVSTNRMAAKLAEHGVKDTDAEWGDYVFPRQWNKGAFKHSLATAEALPAKELNPDGNRAVMLCTTTDPYQTLRNDDPAKQRDLNTQMQILVQEALEHILTQSTLRVRILTRSPLARRDFDLMKRFGNRLLFGMSLPTLNNRLSKIYEPHASAPTQRLETLRAAKAAGIPVYVAVAPVYPECDSADMAATLAAVMELNPHTIFMEPINIRADNVARIEAHARELGEKMNTSVFATPEKWREYATDQLLTFQMTAHQMDIPDTVLHLWPDESLKSKVAVQAMGDTYFPINKESSSSLPYLAWLQSHWNKISAWPKASPLFPSFPCP